MTSLYKIIRKDLPDIKPLKWLRILIIKTAQFLDDSHNKRMAKRLKKEQEAILQGYKR